MTKLSEYLGGLVTEIASARKMADIQTVEIAKEYAQDDLLKHFSIPRMKIGTVDLTVPFAQGGKSVPKIFREFAYEEIINVAKTDYNAADTKNDQELRSFLIDLEVNYNDAIKKIQSQNITQITQSHMKLFDPIPQYVVELCESLDNFSWKTIKPDFLLQSIKTRIFNEAKILIEKTGGDEIIVEAGKLMLLNPNCIIFAKMSVSEAGMEWSRYEDINGNLVETLIPE
nr:hypothetical protein [uncultured Chryseobacterium sp.]